MTPRTMSQQDLETGLASILKSSCEIIVEKGELESTFFLFRGDGRVLVYRRGFGPGDDKADAVAMIRLLAMAVDAVGYALVSEVWTAKENKAAKTAKLLPSQRPDRKEAVIVYGQTHGGAHAFLSREIVRKPGQPVVFGKLDDVRSYKDNLCARILDWSDIPPALRREARQDSTVQQLADTKTLGRWDELVPEQNPQQSNQP